MRIFKSTNCKGQVLVIVALSIITLVTLVGLAIDSGRAYSVKAKLNAALDASALAAARAISGDDQEAWNAGETFFATNYPTDYMNNSTPAFCSYDYNNPSTWPPSQAILDRFRTYHDSGQVTINVWAIAHMPTMFMRIVGRDFIDVYAEATVTKKDVDVAFVVDNTTSLITGSLGDVTDDVKDQSKNFVMRFDAINDRLSLIKFAFGAEVPVPFTPPDRGFDIDVVEWEINHFTFGSTSNQQYTNCAEGFWRALKELDDIPVAERSSLRVIVFFTDGAPNTFSSKFQFRDDTEDTGSLRTSSGSSGTPYGLWEHDVIGERHDDHYHGSHIDWNLRNRVVDGETLLALPTYYNAWDTQPYGYNFHVINTGNPNSDDDVEGPRRVVTPYVPTAGSYDNWGTRNNPDWGTRNYDRAELYEKANRASRNLVEEMAKVARQHGIHVFTLGLGSRLSDDPSGVDQEYGIDILRRMANDQYSDEYNPTPYDLDCQDPDDPDCEWGRETRGVFCHALTEDDLNLCFDKLYSSILRLTM